jgi:hypothetical protein
LLPPLLLLLFDVMIVSLVVDGVFTVLTDVDLLHDLLYLIGGKRTLMGCRLELAAVLDFIGSSFVDRRESCFANIAITCCRDVGSLICWLKFLPTN